MIKKNQTSTPEDSAVIRSSHETVPAAAKRGASRSDDTARKGGKKGGGKKGRGDAGHKDGGSRSSSRLPSQDGTQNKP
jgi:hypothetical protein